MASAASTNAHRVRPAELARMMSVSRQSVHELISRKVIDRGNDGLIDVEMAKIAISNRVRPSAKSAALVTAAPPAGQPEAQAAAPGKTPASDDAAITSYHVAKTLREGAEARLAMLKLAEEQGKLIRADAIRAAHAKRLAGLREALLQIPARLSAVMAAETEQARCHDALQREIHGVLASVAGL